LAALLPARSSVPTGSNCTALAVLSVLHSV
jgi:hypothetical protein